jgi:hypothetical protein
MRERTFVETGHKIFSNFLVAVQVFYKSYKLRKGHSFPGGDKFVN